MTRLRLVGLTLGVLFFSQVGATVSHGQQVRRYRPATPTVSPYLNLLRNDNINALPNYYSLVRPQLQQQAINQQQQALQAQQSTALNALLGQVEAGVTPTGKGSHFMTAGSRATYQNTSRYYPQTRMIRRR